LSMRGHAARGASCYGKQPRTFTITSWKRRHGGEVRGEALDTRQTVWASMTQSDPQPCRNCHSVESMDPHKRAPASQGMMLGLKSGAICIDCYKGIAHHLPKRTTSERR